MSDAEPATGADDTTPAGDTPSSTEPETPPEVAKTPEDLAAEVAHWKDMARKNEKRAKDNHAELEELRRQGMTDQERLVDEARAEARRDALLEVATERTLDAIRSAAEGRLSDVEGLIEGLDPAKFIDDDGNPRRDAIAAWVERIAPKAPTSTDLGQGARGAGDLALGSDPLLDGVKNALGIR